MASAATLVVSSPPVGWAAPIAALDDTPTPVLTASMRRAMQARLDSLREKHGIPGISAAVIFPDGSTWLGTSGMADIEQSAPVTTDTAFAMASVSKTFTAALIMALVQDGRLSLDTTAASVLPSLRLDPAVTVRQLLDHTSGLHDFFFGKGVDAALLGDPGRRWDIADSMDFVGKPYFKSGTGWHYSNTNYLVLGAIAETVGGAPLGEQLRTRFLDPLGLTHTTYQPDEAPRGPVAHGYRFRTGSATAPAIDLTDGSAIVPFTSVVTAAAGAGGIASTAGDVARWARALYEGDALDEATVQAMVDDVAITAPFRPRRPYGLGVQALPISGHPALGHSGRFIGSRSVVRWLPDSHLTVAVLTNQSRVDPAIVARALVNVALSPTRAAANPAVR
jgi:CubicO group peptidase (beta-lactamase class C family)